MNPREGRHISSTSSLKQTPTQSEAKYHTRKQAGRHLVYFVQLSHQIANIARGSDDQNALIFQGRKLHLGVHLEALAQTAYPQGGEKYQHSPVCLHRSLRWSQKTNATARRRAASHFSSSASHFSITVPRNQTPCPGLVDHGGALPATLCLQISPRGGVKWKRKAFFRFIVFLHLCTEWIQHNSGNLWSQVSYVDYLEIQVQHTDPTCRCAVSSSIVLTVSCHRPAAESL